MDELQIQDLQLTKLGNELFDMFETNEPNPYDLLHDEIYGEGELDPEQTSAKIAQLVENHRKDDNGRKD
jgi:hypothetical protein